MARSDYSIIKPVLQEFKRSREVEVSIILSGMHLSPEFGSTENDVIRDGWMPEARIEHLISSDTPCGFAKSMGLGITSFADFFNRNKPDILFLTGDRSEMLAAGLAAVPFGVPIAHLHGGETTEGAIDEVFRHSLTKMSSLHFVTTNEYSRRVRQMGESSDSIFFAGAPALDNLKSLKLMSAQSLEKIFGVNKRKQPIIVTMHPETFNLEQSTKNVRNVIAALTDFDNQVIFTASNADAKGREINQIIKKEVNKRDEWLFFNNLSTRAYYSAMAISSLMVGNSSSGIIEAASFDLRVINVGNRQRGRVRGSNVYDVSTKTSEIKRKISEVLVSSRNKKNGDFENPYYNGGASKIIVQRTLEAIKSGISPVKKFHDLGGAEL